MTRIPKDSETDARTYTLPTVLIDRLQDYQAANNIFTEDEAVRELLEEAFQAQDTLDSIMIKVRDTYRNGRDLRKVAQNVLSGHLLVKYIIIDDDHLKRGRMSLKFGLKNGDAGAVFFDGSLKKGTVNDDGKIWLSEDWEDPFPPGWEDTHIPF